MDLWENFGSSDIADLPDFSRKYAKNFIIHIIETRKFVNLRLSNREKAWDNYI